jgi:rare lipoprotein A
MVTRLGAAICGAAVLLSCSSAAMARADRGLVSHAVHKVSTSGGASRHFASIGSTIFGAASMYNPFEPGWREGGPLTATGERYDPFAWTAAIQSGLRGMFGGVRHGAKPRYALVEGGGKKAIVKINDVGPLTPGRVIDFNKQTMRYFDPSLQRGVIHNVKVTALSGEGWTLGPVAQSDGPKGRT